MAGRDQLSFSLRSSFGGYGRLAGEMTETTECKRLLKDKRVSLITFQRLSNFDSAELNIHTWYLGYNGAKGAPG